MSTRSAALRAGKVEPSVSPAIRASATLDGQRLIWTRADAASVSAIVLAAVAAVVPFWQPGVASANDMLMGIYRVFELARGWEYGILYPRLGADLNFTYGAPLFQFYPPLASYGALLFHSVGLGWIESTKATFTLSLLLAGVGSYVYARWLFRDHVAAFVSGSAYVLAPYLFTVIFERGAAAESLALGLVPWVVWALHRLLDERNRGGLWVAAVLIALLMLAHNITALFAIPALTAYVLLVGWREHGLRPVVDIGAAIALGLGLAAFYWIPAIAEVKFTQIQSSMLSGSMSPLQNLTPLSGLVQSSLVVDYWGPERFEMALWQAVLGGLAILGLATLSRRPPFPMALLAGMLAAMMFLQTTLSQPFWESVPLTQFIQFPWRLLGLSSFCVALLLGAVFLNRPLTGSLGRTLAAGLVVAILLLGTYRLRPELSSIWYPITSAEIGVIDLLARSHEGFSLSSDFAPATQEIDSRRLARARSEREPTTEPLSAMPDVQVLDENPNQVAVQVQTDQPFPLRIHRVFFPGWQAYIDGQPTATIPTTSPGLVTVNVPAGDHHVRFQFEDTPVRRLATGISLLSCILVGVCIVRWRRKAGIVVATTALLLATTGAAIGYHRSSSSLHRPVAYAASFKDDLRLVGFELPKRTWKPGDLIPLRLYWLSRQTPTNDYHVFVHLTTADGSSSLAKRDGLPMLGFAPPTRWEPGELLADLQELQVGPSTPPGTYLLVAGLRVPGSSRTLPVEDAPATLPGNRVILGEVEISNP